MQRELAECKIAERTVREYVHEGKIALGLMTRETCVPQSYAWGVEAQVDWYEASAGIAGERIKLQAFGTLALLHVLTNRPSSPLFYLCGSSRMVFPASASVSLGGTGSALYGE